MGNLKAPGETLPENNFYSAKSLIVAAAFSPYNLVVGQFQAKVPTARDAIHRYRDERLLIRFAHPGLKSWAGARDSQANR